MMRLAVHIDYVDGSGVDSTASAPDFIAFERKYDLPMQVFSENARIEHMLWLAWHALNRRKQTEKDFDAWIDDVDSVDFGDKEANELVPLESSQPTG